MAIVGYSEKPSPILPQSMKLKQLGQNSVSIITDVQLYRVAELSGIIYYTLQHRFAWSLIN